MSMNEAEMVRKLGSSIAIIEDISRLITKKIENKRIFGRNFKIITLDDGSMIALTFKDDDLIHYAQTGSNEKELLEKIYLMEKNNIQKNLYTDDYFQLIKEIKIISDYYKSPLIGDIISTSWPDAMSEISKLCDKFLKDVT